MGTYALTGGASGIGAALSQLLAAEGHQIINVDIRNADVIADLSTEAGRQAAAEGIAERAPDGLDGFVPLAGVGAGTGHPATLITSLNYFGTIALVKALEPTLAAKRGSVVLLCSNSAPMSPAESPLLDALLAGDEAAALALNAEENGLEYMTGKRALNYWMRRNAMTLARKGVRVNAVAPGPIDTPMTQTLFENPDMKAAVDGLLSATPIDRMGRPEEVAQVIRFLLSDASAYVCGTLVFVDGGFDAATRSDHL